MAARSSLFGSVVASILHGSGGRDSISLRGCGARRSWPGGFFLTPPPPTSNDSIGAIQQRREDRSVVGMPSDAALASFATTQRALHTSLINGSSSSTPTTAKQMDLPTALAKARAGLTFFRTVIYMCFWVMPRIERLERKLKAQKNSMISCATQANEAAKIILADGDAPTDDVSSVQTSAGPGLVGNKQQPDGTMTGNRTNSVDKLEEPKELETPTMDYEAQIAMLNDLQAGISKLKIRHQRKERLFLI